MKPEMGIPDTKVYEFPGSDESWRTELMEFEDDVRNNRTSDDALRGARAAMEVVEQIYKRDRR
jgi:hypothetical protein